MDREYVQNEVPQERYNSGDIKAFVRTFGIKP